MSGLNSKDAADEGRLPRLRRAAFGAIVLLPIALFAAACGGGAVAPGVASLGSTTVTTSALGTASSGGDANLQQAYQAQLAYAECMCSHGEPGFPDPVLKSHGLTFGAGNDIDQHSQQFISASTTCKRLVPNGGPPSAAQIQAAVAHLLKYAQCMRAHGITNFPDPTVSSGDIGITLKGLDPKSPSSRQPKESARSRHLSATSADPQAKGTATSRI